MASLSDLPAELVALCFGFLPFRDLLRVSHVSRQWRAMAVSYPELWARLEFQHQWQHRATFLSILERSDTMELDATWNYTPGAILTGQDILEAELPRVSVLRIQSKAWNDEHKGSLDRLFGHPLPSLKGFYFDSMCPFSIPPDLSGRAPHLRMLDVGKFIFSTASDRFPNLRILRGSLSEYKHKNQDPRIIFDLCPGLVELELSGVDQRMLDCLSTRPIPNTLRRLCFPRSEGWSKIDYKPLLDALGRVPEHFTASAAVDVCALVEHYVSYLRAPFSIQYGVRYKESAYSHDNLRIRLENYGGECRGTAVLRGALDSPSRLLPHMSHLAQLDCGLHLLGDLIRVSPTMPSLRSLTIVLSAKDPNQCHWEEHGLLLAPSLRALAFDVSEVRPYFVLSADTLAFAHADAVRRWLRFDAPRLESATLYLSRSVYHSPAVICREVFAPWTENVFVGWRADKKKALSETGTWYTVGEHRDGLVEGAWPAAAAGHVDRRPPDL